jgi:hypothetical protein
LAQVVREQKARAQLEATVFLILLPALVVVVLVAMTYQLAATAVQAVAVVVVIRLKLLQAVRELRVKVLQVELVNHKIQDAFQAAVAVVQQLLVLMQQLTWGAMAVLVTRVQ